jgi:hypothetical protein
MITNETFFLYRNFVMTVYLFKFLNNKLSLKTVLVNYSIQSSYNLFFLFGTHSTHLISKFKFGGIRCSMCCPVNLLTLNLLDSHIECKKLTG